jgi:hypothetical protein
VSKQNVTGPSAELRAAYEAACERDRDAWNAYQAACAAHDAAIEAPIFAASLMAWRINADQTQRAAQAAGEEWQRCHEAEHALYVRVMAAYGQAVA